MRKTKTAACTAAVFHEADEMLNEDKFSCDAYKKAPFVHAGEENAAGIFHA